MRLAIAAGDTPDATTAIDDWIWAQVNDASTAEATAPLFAQLAIAPESLRGTAIKSTRRVNTEEALSASIFGVPTLAIADAPFWGEDAHQFALAVLKNPATLRPEEMQRLTTDPVGARRSCAPDVL